MNRTLILLTACLIPLGAFAQGDADESPATATGPSRADEVAALEPAVDTSAAAGSAASRTENTAPPVVAAARPTARPAAAIDRLDLGTTSITGNQELPKVLYIVPWKRSDLGDLIGRPANTLLDEVLAPVDPEVFERHLSYYETLHGDSQEE